jgi:hypothetical protein
MLDHVSLGVTDLERSRRFYDAVLRPLGLVRTVDFQGRGSDYGTMAGQLGVEFTITVEASGASPMRACISASAHPIARQFALFTQRRYPLAAKTMGSQACDRSIIQTITRHSHWILMGTGLKRYATHLQHR